MSKPKLGGGFRSNDKFASLYEGKVRIMCQKGDPGAQVFKKDDGGEYYAQVYDEFTGFVQKIEFKVNNLDASKEDCVITFDTMEDRKTKLQIRVGGGYWFNFSKMIENANLSEPLTVIPKSDPQPDGSKKVSLFLKQGDSFLKSAYTRDNPNDLPQAEKHVIGKGKNEKTVWDFSEQNDFLKEKLTNLKFYTGTNPAFDKALKAGTGAGIAEVPDGEAQFDELPAGGDDDDLPF